MKIRGCFVLGVSLCCSHAPLLAQQRPVSASEFAAQAHAALPLEEPFAFHKALTEWEEPMRRDLAAVPSAQEFALPPNGWSVQFASNSQEIVRTAVREFQSYLRRSMQVQTELKEEPSLEGWRGARRAIVVGTREQLPGCGTGLTRSKDYRVVVSPERVVICGFDEAGAMHGLYHIEARMNLREAPFLPIELDTVRHSLLQARLTLSGLGRDEYPDRYLALLSRYGFDSIYASPYANPNGVSGPQIYARWSKQDPAQVHDLIRRAARYGIRIYCPILYPIAGEPESEAGLRKLVRDIVTEFPEIRGYILLTEGFLYNVDLGTKARGSLDDQRDWLARWSHGIAIAAEEAHRVNPAIEILPWDYNMDYREAMLDVKRYGTGQLPVESIPLLTFENGKGFTRDGERGYLKDYSINEAGPSEVTAAQIEVAKQRGMRAVYSKADTWASWQFGTFPYLPVPYQWYSRYQALEQQGIDGTFESWSYGFKPNFIAEMRLWYCWSDAPELDRLLRAIARREFGAGQEELVLQAWDHFSRAIRLLPDTGPNMGTNGAIGAPLFFEQPRPRTFTHHHSWMNQGYWERSSMINPIWPYTVSRVILNPDFSNRTNAAERYAAPFSLPVFLKYQGLAADEFEQGLGKYRQAALRAPAAKRLTAFREVLLVEQMQRMIRSARAILEFENLRLRLSRTTDRSERRGIVDPMTAILTEELVRTRDSLESARRDSRLGYEWEQDYLCSTDMIEEKIKQVEKTLHEIIPAYRARHGL